MITGKNESKILTKDILGECKCRFDGKNVIQIDGGKTIDVYVSIKNIVCEKGYIWKAATCIAKMENI